MVPTIVPNLSFHSYVGVPPFTGVAVNVTLCPAQILAGAAVTVTFGVTFGFTTMVISVLVLSFGFAQPELPYIVTVTLSPLFNVVILKVGLPLFSPWLVPLINHSYSGAVPTLPGVAVNITFSPLHIGLWSALISTPATTTV